MKEDVTAFCHLMDDGRLCYMRDGCFIELFSPSPIGLGRTLEMTHVCGGLHVMLERKDSE